MSDCRKCAEFDWCVENEDCGLFKLKPMTNADRIRAMTNEELAVFLGNTKAFCCRDRDPSEEFIAEFKTWLKEEAEE